MDVRIYIEVILNVNIKFLDSLEKHLNKKYGARPTHNSEGVENNKFI